MVSRFALYTFNLLDQIVSSWVLIVVHLNLKKKKKKLLLRYIFCIIFSFISVYL